MHMSFIHCRVPRFYAYLHKVGDPAARSSVCCLLCFRLGVGVTAMLAIIATDFIVSESIPRTNKYCIAFVRDCDGGYVCAYVSSGIFSNTAVVLRWTNVT